MVPLLKEKQAQAGLIIAFQQTQLYTRSGVKVLPHIVDERDRLQTMVKKEKKRVW
jgi:hypothetical protein